MNLNLLAEKKYLEKSTSSLSFNFWAKTFWSTFSKFYRTSQGCYRGKMEKKSKRFIDFECQEFFFRVFPKIDFYTSGWLFRNSVWFEVLYIRWYCRFLTIYSRLAISKIISTGSDENWRKTKLFEYFRNWFFSNFVQNIWPLI